MMKQRIVLLLTLLLCGRVMTLPFIGRAGGSGPGDPPAVWLMPLLGDALIGVSGLWIAYLIARKTGIWVWTAIVTWNAVAIWDALSAFVIHKTNPWPDFFMVELFGSSMFFIASLMHLGIILVVAHRDVRSRYLAGC